MSEGKNTSSGSAPCQEYMNNSIYGDQGIKIGPDSELIKAAQIKSISGGSHLIIKEDSEGHDILHNDTEPSSCNPQNEENHKKEKMETDTTSSQNSQENFENEQAADSCLSDFHDSDSATSSNTAERGTQIQFKGLNLEESISSIRGNKVVITFECKRCRQRIDLHLSPSG